MIVWLTVNGSLEQCRLDDVRDSQTLSIVRSMEMANLTDPGAHEICKQLREGIARLIVESGKYKVVGGAHSEYHSEKTKA